MVTRTAVPVLVSVVRVGKEVAVIGRVAVLVFVGKGTVELGTLALVTSVALAGKGMTVTGRMPLVLDNSSVCRGGYSTIRDSS